MRRSIDIKSALIGGLLVALILCLAGAVPFVNQEDYDRFKIEANDSRAYILDSATGQAWTLYGDHPSYDPNFLAIKTLHE